VLERSFYAIFIGGANVTSRFSPLLISLSVELKAGSVSDAASVTLDDTGGQIAMPYPDAEAVIALGWEGGFSAETFRGKVNDVSSHGSRSGRTLTISCTGMDTGGKTKEAKFKHYDQKSISDILQESGKAAGIGNVKVDGSIGSQILPYIAQHNESFVHFGHRIARMFGGTFKIMGDRAVLVPRNEGKSASGAPLTPIVATVGLNLIDWQMAPYIGRPRHKETETRHYDTKKAKWITVSAQTKDTKALAKALARVPTGGEVEAKGRAKSLSKEADREKGGGSVTIDGAPLAQPEAPCILVGTRPGIDGEYIIDAVHHSIDRSGGFVTGLTLKHPNN